jgi:hypothetical protein
MLCVPHVEGLRWVVCAVVVYGGMSPPSSIHSDKELCKKITSGFC